jgi:SecD/SecF fusion protein
MQNKGLIKFFAILFALVSIYQLSFTFVANKVKVMQNLLQLETLKSKYLELGKSVFNLGFTTLLLTK